MLDGDNLASEVPESPKEVNIFQAAGLIPHFADQKTKQSHLDRLRIHDPVIRVYALEQLLRTGGQLSEDVLAMCLHVARRSAWLRQLLVPHLLRIFRFDLLRKVEEQEDEAAEVDGQVYRNYITARKQCDFGAQVALLERLYLLTGNRTYITEARDVARSHLSWRDAWKPTLRVALTGIEPSANTLLNALRMLEREDARQEFKVLGRIIKPMTSTTANVYALAQLLFWDKQYEECIRILDTSKALEPKKQKLSLFENLAARCHEKAGNVMEAARWYQRQNDILADARMKPDRYIKELEHRANWNIQGIPEDKHTNYLIMTGFPRSGTTLLENVLASHEDIVTCEETSSLIGSLATAYQSPIAQDMEKKNINLRAVFHRDLYYKNLTRYSNNPNAKVIIDKTPIIGSNIKYMEKIFSNKRYIFSIRHPYDVVLSNFKQDYAQNIAMAAFNDIYNACVLYDYVMKSWFEVFPGETDRVHYIKYDDLVNDFDRVIEGALEFIGVEWTEDVRNFAENAGKRAVRTPSYANVRKGLTIGVQTSWQKFDFLFDPRCRELLDPWVERFGYPPTAEA